MIPLMRCDDPVVLTVKRIQAGRWFDRFPQIGGWLYTTIAESPRHAYLHTALSRMTPPGTGGLLEQLRKAEDSTALYHVSSSFEVALCHRDEAFEGGPGALRLLTDLYEKKRISMPPCITRLREIEATKAPVDIILLPPSPLLSNQTRLQLATPALMRKRTFEELPPEGLR
jgi:hypothetical protein